MNTITDTLPHSNIDRARLLIPATEINEYGNFIPSYSFLLREELFDLLEIDVDDTVSNDALLKLVGETGLKNVVVSDRCPITQYDASEEMLEQFLGEMTSIRLQALGDYRMKLSFSDSAVHSRLRFKDIIEDKGTWLVFPTFVGNHISIKSDKYTYKVRSKIREYVGTRGGNLHMVFPEKVFTANSFYFELINLLIENSLERTRHESVLLFNAPTNLLINKKYITENKENIITVKRKKNV